MDPTWLRPAEPGEITPTKSAASRAAGRRVAKAPKQPGEVPKAPIGPENAVTARLLKTKMCYFFERGKCASKTCRYAHSLNELRKQPNLQKTKLCKAFADGLCTRGDDCVFAHGEVQLRVTDGIYKTQMCHFFERGRCLKGERCNHAHGPEDLRRPPPREEDGTAGVPSLVSPVATPGKGDRNGASPLPLADLTQAMASIAAAAAVQASQAAVFGMCTPPPETSSNWGMPWSYGGIATPESYYLGPSPQLMPPMLASDDYSYPDAWGSQVQPCDLNDRLDRLAPASVDLSADVQKPEELEVTAPPAPADELAQRRIHRI